MKKVVIVTTSQLSINPRVVKEANAISHAGFEVVVLYCFKSEWALQNDKLITSEVKWNSELIGGTPLTLQYQLSRLRRKLCEKFGAAPNLRKYIVAQSYSSLLQEAINQKGDLYIGHNIGALPVVAQAALATKAIYAFDAEDYHSCEHEGKSLYNKISFSLEKIYLPGAAYISVSSPLIAEAYSHLNSNSIVIHNAFSLKYQGAFQSLKVNKPIKLFWFSQTIGLDRGLNDLFDAIQPIAEVPIEIGLLGSCTQSFKDNFSKLNLSPNHKVEFYTLRSEQELIELAAQYHIGLALERTTPYNRNICLTNKIFVYLISGLAIIASETLAQRRFIEENPGIGFTYSIQKKERLTEIIKSYYTDICLLNLHRKNAYSLAAKLQNWEQEKVKLTNYLSIILK